MMGSLFLAYGSVRPQLMMNVTRDVASRSKLREQHIKEEPKMTEHTIAGLPPRDVGPANELSRGRLSWIIPVAALLLVAIPLSFMW